MRLILFLVFFIPFIVKAQLSGTINVPGTFSSVASAFAVLNSNGVSAPVTIIIANTHTEVAPPNGYTISASGNATNAILITGAGGLQRPILLAPANGNKNAGSSMQDGILRLIGADYIEIRNIEFRDQNTIAPQTMEFGIGLFNAGVNDGCNHVKIADCKISLSNLNNASGNLPAVDGSRGIEIVNALSSAHTGSLAITNQSGAHSNNQFIGNHIEFCNYGIVALGSQDQAPYLNANYSNTIGGLTAASGNTIVNFGGGGTNASAAIRLSAQYDVLVANNVILSNTGVIANHQGSFRGIYINAAPGANSSVEANSITLHSGASTAQLSAIENQSGAQGTVNSIRIINNTVTACSYSSATAGNFYAIVNSASAGKLNIEGNVITNNSTAANSGANYLIYNSGVVSKLCLVSNNTLNMHFTGLAAYQGNFAAIYSANSATSCAIKINKNTFQNIISTRQAATGLLQFIYHTADADTLQINENLWKNINLNHSGANYMIQNMSSVNSVLSVCSNSVQNYFRLQAANTWFYYANSSTSANAVHTLTGNIISNLKYLSAGTGSIVLFQSTDGGQSPYPVKRISSNTITAIDAQVGTGFTAFSISDVGYGSTSAGSEVKSNKIENISVGETCNGILLSAPVSNSTALVVQGNTLTGLSSKSNSASTNGLILNAGGGNVECALNKISELASQSSSGSVTAVFINSAGSYNLHHNVIGALTASLTSGQNRINGIYINTASQLRIYYNSIRLQASSTASLFGSNALYCSSTPSLDLRNNIFVNLSLASGTAQTVAFRRSSTSNTTYSLSSNNNVLYAGLASPQNLLFYNGSVGYQTLPALQTALAPRESVSISSPIPFRSITAASANFLHLADNQSNVAESAGLGITNYSLDIDADIIQGNAGYAGTGTAPDIGADETDVATSTCTAAPNYSFSALSASVCAFDVFYLAALGKSNGTGLQYQWEQATATTSFSAINSATLLESAFTFTTAGIYYLHLKSTCAAASSTATSPNFTLQVVQTPTLTSVATQTYCAGTNASLQVQGNAGSYFWFGPNAFTSTVSVAILPNVQNYQAGTYSLLATNCACAAPIQTLQLAVDQVTVLLNANPPAICIGGSSTLSAIGNAQSYLWSNGANSFSTTLTPSTTTNYSLFAISSNSCTVTKTLQLSVVQPSISAINSTLCLPAVTTTIGINTFTPAYVSWYTSNTGAWPIANSTLIAVSPTNTSQWFAKASLLYDKSFSATASTGSLVPMFMFDIQVQNSSLISGFDLNVANSGTCQVSVYARQGSFQSYSTTANGWNLLTSSLAIPSTFSNQNTVHIDFDYFIPGTLTAGFAISIASNSLVTAAVSGSALGNQDILISQTAGGNTFSVTQTQSNFQGTVYYRKESCASPIATVQVDVNASPSISISPANLTVCQAQQVTITAGGANTYSWSNSASTASTLIAPLSSTVISVYGSSLGCTSQASLSVFTFTPSLPIVTAVVASVCPNQSVMLTASGLLSYTWSTGPNGSVAVVYPAASTAYTVFGHDANTCFVSNTIAIATKTPPLLSVLSVPETFCAGEKVELFAGGALNYTWQPSATQSNSLGGVVVTTTMALVVVGTGVNTCTNSTFIVLAPNVCLDVNTTNTPQYFKIFPQPCTNYFNFSVALQVGELSLISTSGQLIKKWPNIPESNSYIIEDVPPGLYLLRHTDLEGRFKYSKLVKQ